MMSKIPSDDSEEVLSSDLIVDMEADVPTVRYNPLAYDRKIKQQVAEEYQAQPLTQRSESEGPITQRAIPKR